MGNKPWSERRVVHFPDFVWTDASIEKLKSLYAEGVSSSTIGKILGTTRNAIIGKVHRLKLHLQAGGERNRAGGRTSAAMVRASRQPKQTTVHPFAPKKVRVSVKRETQTREVYDMGEAPPGIGADRKGLIDLDTSDCRWPIGDPRQEGFHFCALTKVEGTSYCEYHARMAFQPPARKRDATDIYIRTAIRRAS